MDPYHRQSLHLLFFTLFLLIFLICGNAFAQSPADYGRTWQDLPVIPEFSDHAREILKAGIAAGHDPHAFTKVGDCDTSTSWYLSDYDRDRVYYDLGEYDYLQSVIDFFKGSFVRLSFAAKPGFSAASALSTFFMNYEYCNYDEVPLTCEYRIHDPIAVLISLGTNDGYNPPVFKENMRKIIDITIEQNRLPILMLKADNVEGNFSINQDIADLAAEYDIPVWNFWASVQNLKNHGLQDDGIHLTFYSNYFSQPKTWETAFAYRNLTTLQVLEKLQMEIVKLLEK